MGEGRGGGHAQLSLHSFGFHIWQLYCIVHYKCPQLISGEMKHLPEAPKETELAQEQHTQKDEILEFYSLGGQEQNST